MDSIDIIAKDDSQFYLDKENFNKVVTDNNLIVLKENAISSLQECIIDEEVVSEAVDFDDTLFEKIIPYVIEYNNKLKFVDFEKPVATYFYAIYQGFQFTYMESPYDFLTAPNIALDTIKEEFYKNINETEILEAKENRKKEIDVTVDEIFELMKEDSDFCFVCNEKDRNSFMDSFFTKYEVIDILKNHNIKIDYHLRDELGAKIRKEDIYRSEHYRELRKKRNG